MGRGQGRRGGSTTVSKPSKEEVVEEPKAPPENKTYELSKETLAGKYRLIDFVEKGSFGQIWVAKDKTDNDREVAIKLEKMNVKVAMLKREAEFHMKLTGGKGIPPFHGFYEEFGWNFLVMDLLGPNLETLLEACQGRFKVKTVMMIAWQMINRLEHVHSQGLLHRDLKPANMCVGRRNHSQKVYLVDFGLCKSYKNEEGNHIKFRADKVACGTARYASLNVLLGGESSRRDDMEALANVLVYFLRGNLPWSGINAGEDKAKNLELCADVRMDLSIEKICEGHPAEFVTFYKYTRNLKFDETPDYVYCRKIFTDLYYSMGYTWDYEYDWDHLDLGEERNNYYYSASRGVSCMARKM